MRIAGHKPYYKGTSCFCVECGQFLFDVRTGARLKALQGIDEVKLAAVERRFSSDPKLAKRLVDKDPQEVVSAYKLADKFNDFLMNPKARPDLQTPEAQHFLQILRGYRNPKTDPLMPWLAREWKKGRIRPYHGGRIQFDGGPDYEYEDGTTGEPTSWHNLTESGLDHWADWYGSDHPSRRGVDIMQMKSPELHQTIKDWDTDMREKAKSEAQIRGDIVHSYPDGWSVQQLTTPQQLKDEGEAMGHCVGSYAGQVANGDSLIYSLRDAHNEPHATWEITPQWWEDEEGNRYHNDQFYGDPNVSDQMLTLKNRGILKPLPYEGVMEQIQGKGNEAPIPEYQKRIKDYFEHAMSDELPQWADQHYNDVESLIDPEGPEGYITYHPGDYGLDKPQTTYDWPSIVGDQIAYEDYDSKAFVEKAVQHNQFIQMAEAARKRIEDLKQFPADEYSYNLEAAIEAQRRREKQTNEGSETVSRLENIRTPHEHFSTGEPCYCTFCKPESFGWHQAVFMDSEPDSCPTCGDPLEHGKCKRCDWGQWSNAMGSGDQNPQDPTKEFHPSIQASNSQ